jgi:DNA-binding transcriptional LysR family regulator
MKSLSRDFMDDLGRLRVLREFRERQSVTATAQALHLTPSAVSQQLAGLSRDLGFAVTQREGRGLVLTPRGQALLAHADLVFAQIERARHDLDTWDDNVRGTVAIGAFSTAITGLLPQMLDKAREEIPMLTIRLREAEPPAIFDQLDAGRLDIALAVSFAGSPAAADPRYHRVDLGPDELDIALPSSHPRAADDHVSLRDLETDPWIAGDPQGCCGAITATACAAAGFAPRIVHRTNDWQALTRLVARGHGVALIPRLAQRDLPPALVIRPTAGQTPQRQLFAAVPQGGQDSSLVKPVLALLVTVNDQRHHLPLPGTFPSSVR